MAGRPEYPEEEKRSVYVMVRLTKKEKEQVYLAAKYAMRTPSDFCRTVVLNAVKKALG
jgi:hypothetical protein